MRQHSHHFDALRRANPVPPDQLPPSPSHQDAWAFLEETIDMELRTREHSDRSEARMPRRRSPRPLILAGAALALGTTVGAIYLTRDVSESLTVGCYATADLQGDTAVVGANGSPPEEACADLWERGEFGPGGVPELGACVLPSGAVGVFPGGDQTCGELGLALVEANYGEDVGAAVALRDALVERFSAADCLGFEESVSIVEEELAERGMTEWSIEAAGPFTDSRPCTGLAFDTDNQIVSLVPDVDRQRRGVSD